MAICLINDGCLTATADDGYLTGLYMLQALCKQQRKNTCYTRMSLYQKKQRETKSNITQRNRETTMPKNRCSCFLLGSGAAPSPPMTPLLLRFYTYSTQESGKTTVRTYSRYPKSPIINNKTLNRSKPIRNSKQTLNQP